MHKIFVPLLSRTFPGHRGPMGRPLSGSSWVTFLGVLDQCCLSPSLSPLNMYSLYFSLRFSMNTNLFNHCNLKHSIKYFQRCQRAVTFREIKYVIVTLQVLNSCSPFFLPVGVGILKDLFFILSESMDFQDLDQMC